MGSELLADCAHRLEHTMKFTILLMCFLNLALLVTSSPVPQYRQHSHPPPHQRRPHPLSFLEDFFQRTLGFFSNSTFGSSPPPPNKRQSNLSYEGNHLPTDDQILNGL